MIPQVVDDVTLNATSPSDQQVSKAHTKRTAAIIKMEKVCWIVDTYLQKNAQPSQNKQS